MDKVKAFWGKSLFNKFVVSVAVIASLVIVTNLLGF
jgi:hypothetical protein